jgi:hypothetical protein
MAGEFGPRPSSDFGSVQTEFFVHPVLAEERRGYLSDCGSRSLIASQNRGDPTDAVGLWPSSWLDFYQHRATSVSVQSLAVTENLKAIYRGSRLLDIAETDLRRRHRPLQNLPYEEQMLEGLGAFDGALSPGGGLVDSLSPPSLAK